MPLLKNCWDDAINPRPAQRHPVGYDRTPLSRGHPCAAGPAWFEWLRLSFFVEERLLESPGRQRRERRRRWFLRRRYFCNATNSVNGYNGPSGLGTPGGSPSSIAAFSTVSAPRRYRARRRSIRRRRAAARCPNCGVRPRATAEVRSPVTTSTTVRVRRDSSRASRYSPPGPAQR